MLKIKYSTEPAESHHAAGEARALVALLVSIHGPGILPVNADLGEMIAEAQRIPPQPMTDGAVATEPARTPLPFSPDASAPMVAAPPAPPAPPAVIERDSAGIPWDAAIHTEAKSKKQDGTWRRRKGVDDAAYDARMAELRQANTRATVEAAAAAGVIPAPPPPHERAIPVPPGATAAVVVPPPPTASPFDAPPVVMAPTPPAATGHVTFADFMTEFATAQNAGKITPEMNATILAAGGLATILEASGNTEGRQLAYARFKALVPE